jgi:oligopeptide/dipeptide ABC transporter ATP-binding protein
MSAPLLHIDRLTTVFPVEDRLIPVVQEVGFSIPRGRTVGVVGESGCGKSMTGLSILQLVPRPGRIADGRILFYRQNGSPPVDIAQLDPRGEAMRSIRGNEIAMIFQEPMTSLNPVYPIGEQIGEAVRLHQGVGRKEARARAVEMLRRVGIPGPQQRVDEYPHQLSGGMRQRAMIAMALSCNPTLLIADEPTTALDVTIQAQIIDLLRDLQAEFHMAIMIITHDLGVIADLADEIIVMYAGRVVEAGTPEHLFYRPHHPYTRGLLGSIPKLGARRAGPLQAIPGTVPSPLAMPPGCPFQPRCPVAIDRCAVLPEIREIETGHTVRCWRE